MILLVAVWILVVQSPPDTLVEQRIGGRVSESRLRAHVRELVQKGNRLGGTPSGRAAAGYVAGQFRSFGLKPEKIVEPPKLTFVHRSWSVDVVHPVSDSGAVRGAALAGFSPSVAPTEARLVLVEQGTRPQGHGSGPMLLTDRRVDRRFYQDAIGGGAVGILSSNGADSIHYASWALLADLPPSKENPIPLYTISNRQYRRLRSSLERSDSVVIRFSAETATRDGSPVTVTVTIPGVQPEYYLVCAHGDADSGGPGADDNASGVAAVLELARLFSGMISRGELRAPDYGIRFAVWGSEYYSTEQYVLTQRDSLELLKGVLNFDEVGIGADRDCLYFEPNDVPWNEPVLRVLESVAEEHVGRPGFWREATTNPGMGGTDSYVFLPEHLERLGIGAREIPSVTVFTAAWDRPRTMEQTPGWSSTAWSGHPDTVIIDHNRYYHSLLDVPERTTEREPFNMVWAVKAVGMGLYRLAWEQAPAETEHGQE